MTIDEIGTFEHEGVKISHHGAFFHPDAERAVAYLAEDERSVTTWQGEFLGHARVVARWPINSHFSTTMLQVEATINGIRFTGRTLGGGMLWKGKRKKESGREVRQKL